MADHISWWRPWEYVIEIWTSIYNKIIFNPNLYGGGG